MTAQAEHMSFSTPDETRSFRHGEMSLLKIGGAEIGLLTLQPGWRWSEHVKPTAGTELCQAPHFQDHVTGTLRIVMADGSEFTAQPGDVTALPQGHAALSTSMVCYSSRLRRYSSRISCADSLLVPGAMPASTSAWRTHLREVGLPALAVQLGGEPQVGGLRPLARFGVTNPRRVRYRLMVAANTVR